MGPKDVEQTDDTFTFRQQVSHRLIDSFGSQKEEAKEATKQSEIFDSAQTAYIYIYVQVPIQTNVENTYILTNE